MGSKKKTQEPVKYYATFEQAVCMAPVDAIVSIKINDEIAYNEPITQSKIFAIDAPNLFGGDKSEGGVSGSCEARFGYMLQEKSQFLIDKTKELFSACRGILSIVAKDFYIGQSPYAKPWHFRIKSTLLNYDYTDNWYRERATIAHDSGDDSSRYQGKHNYGVYWRVISDRTSDELYGYAVTTHNTFTVLQRGESAEIRTYNAKDMSVVDGKSTTLTHNRYTVTQNPWGGATYTEVTTPVKILLPIMGTNYYDTTTYASDSQYTNDPQKGALTNFSKVIASRAYVSQNNGYWVMRRPINSSTNYQYDWCLGIQEYRETGHFGRETIYNTVRGDFGTSTRSDDLVFTDGICCYHGYKLSDQFMVDGVKAVNGTANTGYGTVFYSNQGTFNADDTVLAFAIDSEKQIGYLIVKNGDDVIIRVNDISKQSNIENVSVGTYTSLLPNSENGECCFVLTKTYMIGFCGTTVIRFLRSLELANYDGTQLDYNPAHAIREAITSKVWGLGKDPSVIDDANFRAVADVLYQEQLGISFVFESDDKVADFIADVLRIIGGVLRVDRSTGLVQLKLFRDDYDVSELLKFDSDNVLEIKDVKRTALNECVNQVTVKYKNWETGEDASMVYQDLALLQQQGEPINTDFDYPYVYWKETACKLAQRDLYENASQFLSCSLTVGLQGRTLNLGDCIVLDFPHLGIENSVFRILKINYGGSASNNVEMELVQDKFFMPNSVGYTSGGTPIPSVPSVTQNFDYARVIELPYYILYKLGQDPDSMLSDDETAGKLETLVSAYNTVRVDSAEEYITTNNTSFNHIGTISKDNFVPSCVLANSLTELVTSMRYENGSNLSSVNYADGYVGFIDDEIVGIGEIDPYYKTVRISRGLFDTVPAKHSAGAVLYIASLANDEICNSDEFTGAENYMIKIAVVSGGTMANLVATNTHNIVFDARCYRPYPPASVQINSLYFPNMASIDWYNQGTCTWKNRNRLTQIADDYLLWTDDTNVNVESDTVYKCAVSNKSKSIYSVSSFNPTDNSYAIIIPCDIEGFARVEIWSERNDVASLQKIVIEGEMQDLIMVPSFDLTTGNLTMTMNNRNPTTFEIVNGELEVTCPDDYHTVYSRGTGNEANYMIRTYEV